VARIAERFTSDILVDAIVIGINCCMRTGEYRPIPIRIRILMAELTVERFYGMAITDESRRELTGCILKAVKPWRG